MDEYRMYMSSGVQAAVEEYGSTMDYDIVIAMRAFSERDWGLVCDEDWEANDCDVEAGGFALGRYKTVAGDVWIESGFEDGYYAVVMFPYER